MYAIHRKKSGSGCASEFYKLSSHKNRGFKSFDDYELAQIAHYNQKTLSQFDLAPRVYSEVGRVRIGKSKKLSRWGYITEIAELVCCPGNDCECCDRDSIENALDEEMSNLIFEIEDCGFYFGDCHPGNVGYVTRGKDINGLPIRLLVCIDTGDESVSSDNGPCFCLECKKGGNCRE